MSIWFSNSRPDASHEVPVSLSWTPLAHQASGSPAFNNCSCLHCVHNIACSESNGVTLRSWHTENAWFIFLYIFLKTSRLNFHSTTISSPAPGKTTKDHWLFLASDVFIFAPSVGYFHFVRPFYGQLTFDIHLLQRIGLQRVIFVIDLSICLFVSCLFWSTKKPGHLAKSQFTTV